MTNNEAPPEEADPPCYPRACAIQACLDSNGWDQTKCQKQVDALYDCCREFYQKTNDKGKTPCCPKPSLLRLKLQQRENDKQGTRR